MTKRAAAVFLALMTLAVEPAPAMLAHRSLGGGGRQTAAEGVPSKDGMVVCTSAPACDAGAGVLAKGGNAVDAAVATAFALAVTHPSAGNIGGGGFIVYRPATGAAVTYDFREKAPARATPTMINLGCFWLFEIPLSYVLGRSLGFGPPGVFLAMAIAFSVMSVISAALFRRGGWKLKRV